MAAKLIMSLALCGVWYSVTPPHHTYYYYVAIIVFYITNIVARSQIYYIKYSIQICVCYVKMLAYYITNVHVLRQNVGVSHHKHAYYQIYKLIQSFIFK